MVVAQLRFPPEMALAQPETMTAIQAGLRDRYPIALGRESRLEVEIVAGPGDAPQVSPSVVTPGPLRFADEQNEWIASVATDALSLETKIYHNGEEFKARWAELVTAFLNIVTPARVDRFGVRYINQLAHTDARSVEDWSRFLDTELMGSIASPVLSSRVVRASDQAWLAVGIDGGSIRRVYSQNPAGVTPSSVIVLDFDLFSAEPFPFGIEEIGARFDRYHKWAWNLFRRSITDEMVSALGEAE